MSGDEPTRATIVFEIVVFALLFLLVGAAFVEWRTLREGPRVLRYDLRNVETK
jgi:hypothetical protein